MKNNATSKTVLTGLFIALVFLCTYFTRIPGPVPPGYINFGDAVIMVAAVMFGRNYGFFAGSIGSALADIISPGGIIFAPITFVVKGLEGYITGVIASYPAATFKGKEILKIGAVCTGALIMVLGYFTAEAYILRLFDRTFGYTAAVTELPFNLIQGGISSIIGYVLIAILDKVNVKRILE